MIDTIVSSATSRTVGEVLFIVRRGERFPCSYAMLLYNRKLYLVLNHRQKGIVQKRFEFTLETPSEEKFKFSISESEMDSCTDIEGIRQFFLTIKLLEPFPDEYIVRSLAFEPLNLSG